MSLRLSVNRCGFDMGAGELRDAVADLTRLAGEMGAAIGVLNGTAADTRATVSVLRNHRSWLLDQAELLAAKLRLHEERALKGAIHGAVVARVVTLPVWPIGPVRIERRQ
jgi:hypothetical protein